MKSDRYTSIVANEETEATILTAILINAFSTEYFDWEPETLRVEVEDLWGEIPEVNYDKIWAIVTLLTTDQTFHSPEIFANTMRVLSNNPASFDMWEIPTPDEIMWGFAECYLIDPEAIQHVSQEVKIFVKRALEEHGIWRVPKLLMPVVETETGQTYPDGDLFSDDPDMFEMMSNKQNEDIVSLENYVREKINGVVDKVNNLGFTEKPIDLHLSDV